MRELKFRAWHKERFFGSIGRFEYFNLYKDAGEILDDWFHDDDNFEQYTGLKDKNGKEIYEGDILGDMWGGGYIAWCDKCKQLQYHISTHECMACLGDVQWYELVEDNGKLEVIGNIHENKELLGK